VGIAPEESTRLYSETGSLTGGVTLEELWNYYAKRCGADKSFAETSYQAVGSRSGEVEYLLLDTFAQK
jgi:hypothetical protein